MKIKTIEEIRDKNISNAVRNKGVQEIYELLHEQVTYENLHDTSPLIINRNRYHQVYDSNRNEDYEIIYNNEVINKFIGILEHVNTKKNAIKGFRIKSKESCNKKRKRGSKITDYVAGEIIVENKKDVYELGKYIKETYDIIRYRNYYELGINIYKEKKNRSKRRLKNINCEIILDMTKEEKIISGEIRILTKYQAINNHLTHQNYKENKKLTPKQSKIVNAINKFEQV